MRTDATAEARHICIRNGGKESNAKAFNLKIGEAKLR